MKRLLMLILCLPFLLRAQPFDSAQGDKGIKWATGLSWNQVKEKAKKENKYIFLDCYTTWCGPCKMMDKEVYVQDSVGLLFNEKFIAVKVQMDRTKNDDDFIQSWYKDADTIGKQYKIEGFPSFIFLTSNGNITHKAVGYTTVKNFIETAQLALKPGKTYDDDYAEYDQQLVDYKNGVIHYNRMLYMIRAAQRFDPSLVPELNKLYDEFIDKLNAGQRFTTDIIAYCSMRVVNSKSKYFPFFYKSEKRIDKVMMRKGYAASVVDNAIYNEIVLPFFNEQNKYSNLPMTGSYEVIKSDYSEADWKILYITIRNKFNKSTSKRSLLKSKLEWYTRHFNYEAIARTQLDLLEKNPEDLKTQTVTINGAAWDAFLGVTDKKILNSYIEWMEKVVRIREYPQYKDTYACLLYKVGKKEEAISWEKKAVTQAAKYKKVVEQMEHGEPVYGVKPL